MAEIPNPSTSTAALVPSSSTTTKRLSTMPKAAANSNANQASSDQVVKGRGAGQTGNAAGSGTVVKDVLSPGELCGFVDTLLNQLETRFEDMSEQLVTKMNEMSARIDGLENTIQDLMHDGIDAGASSPSPSSKR